MDIIHADFETRSAVPIHGPASVGLYNYVTHPTTAALMLAWCLNDQTVNLWEIAQGEPMPAALAEALRDPQVQFAAWNSAFERHFFKYHLGADIPYGRWLDPQISARYLSLPDDLEDCGPAIGLPHEFYKDHDGDRLIKLFSDLVPEKKSRKKKGEEQHIVSPAHFNDWKSHPEDWVKFGNYCKQDVVSEREIMRRMAGFRVMPLPPRLHQEWMIDQKINDKGMPTDRSFVNKSSVIGQRAKADALAKQKAMTGLDNPNSRDQMLVWCKAQGYTDNTIRKEYVARALENPDLPQIVKDVLGYRNVSASTSYRKLETIDRQLCPDDRLRNSFIFLGSSRCGRWSSGASQLHNMARPEPQFEEEEVMDEVRKLIYAEDYDGLVRDFKEPLLAVKSTIRCSFVAPEGKRLNVVDLNAIETRVAAWLAQCQPLLDVFARPDGDPYYELASKMTGIPYEDLYRDGHGSDKKLKAIAKRHRQVAKPGVLGCVYRLSGGGWGTNKYGDPIKTGLWGYAENMKVKMSQKEAHEVVKVFRASYPEICELWKHFEKAVEYVLDEKSPRDAYATLGPNGCIRIDKLNRKDRYPVMRMRLPSGRFLHYFDAHLEMLPAPWTVDLINPETDEVVLDKDGKPVQVHPDKVTIVYSGVDQETKQWRMGTTTHGGKLTENAVQGIARDVLSEAMIRVDAEDIDLVGHVHDELITETDDDAFSVNNRDLERMMSIPMPWALDLPLGADGYSGYYYHK